MENPTITDRVYISGPMSGLKPEQYRPRFELAEKILRDRGYINIISPIHFWPARFPWLFRLIGYKLTLFIDLWILTRCNRIYKLPDWKQSRGSSIESCVAFHFGVFQLAKPVRKEIDDAINNLDKQRQA